MLTAFTTAVKFNEDKIYRNKHYSSVGGVNAAELSVMEYAFLKFINYDLFVNAKEYYDCLNYSERNSTI